MPKNSNRNRIGIFLFPAVFLLLFPALVFADFQLLDAIQQFGEKRYVTEQPTRLQAGPIQVHPFLKTKLIFDDNILLEDRDGRGDLVFNVQPGIILNVPIDTHQVTVGYEADIESFTKSRHHNQNDQNQNLFVLADLRFPSWYVNVFEQFSETSGRAGTTFTGRIPRIDHSIHPKIGYRWKRMTLELGFRHFVRDFRRQVDDSLDFEVAEWTAVLYYDLFARLKALVEYQVSQIDYDDNFLRAATVQQARVGLEGEVLPNLKVQLRVGPQFRNYEESSEPDFNSWVASALADYEMRERLRFDFSFDRNAIEATFNQVNYFLRHIVRFGTEYDFLPRWTLFSKLKYYRDLYAERSTVGTRTGFRRDDHFTLKSGLRYVPREWLDMELAYEFFRRDSNFSTLDYTNHRLSLSTTVAY